VQTFKDAGTLIEAHKHELADSENFTPILCFDRPNIHDPIAVQDAGPECIVDMYHYAADMQKVVEHCHGNNDRLLALRVLELGTGGVRTGKFWHDELRRIHMECTTVEGLQADINSLPATWAHIKTPVAEGGSGGRMARKPFN
jgi:hypothetical protein